MVNQQPTIENFIDAIIYLHRGAPYSKVLASFGISPGQLCHKVIRTMDELIAHASPEDREILILISSDEQARNAVFRMEPEFIDQQYGRVASGAQKRFYGGTLTNEDNKIDLAYSALTKARPELKSTDREAVIRGVRSLPYNLRDYLYHDLRLGGLMINRFGPGEKGSPLPVLELYDRGYQQMSRDASIFDLAQALHQHKWGPKFRAPSFYWQDISRRRHVVHHTLTEENPVLASPDREEVVREIERLPGSLTQYFHRLELGGLMVNAYPKDGQNDSARAVLTDYDEVRQQLTGDTSLLSRSKDPFLEFDSRNRLIRHGR